MKGWEVKNIEELILGIEGSVFNNIEDFNVQNCTQALDITDSFIGEIKNSNFSSNGDSTQRKGGAIHILNSAVSITNVLFSKNTAIKGGAIYFG